MDIARFVTVVGLAAGCALMIPIALGAIAELLATFGSQDIRARATREPLKAPEPLSFPIRSSGSTARRSTGSQLASLDAARHARAARSTRDAA